MANVTIMGASYSDVPAVQLPQTGGGIVQFTDVSATTAQASDVMQGRIFYDALGIQTTGTSTGGLGVITQDSEGYLVLSPTSGGRTYVIPKVAIRPDAQLVKTWTYDKYVVSDEKAELPEFSTTAVTLLASEDIDTYTGDHTNYAYMVAIRVLIIPKYVSSYTDGIGKQEYTVSAANYELLYWPSGTFDTLDQTKTAGVIRAFGTHSAVTRLVYWNTATAITTYTSSAYACGCTMTAPTIASSGVITIKSPAFQIRGHNTYLRQSVFEQVEDIRNQYVIDLWRVPRDPNVINGWDQCSSIEGIVNDIKNNNCKLR